MTSNQHKKLSDLFQEVKNNVASFNHSELKEYMAPHLEAYKLPINLNDFFIQVLTNDGITKAQLQNYLGRDLVELGKKFPLEIADKQITIQVADWQEFQMDSFQKNTIALIIIAAQNEKTSGIADYIQVLSEGMPFVKIYSDINWKEQLDYSRRIEEESGLLQLENLAGLATQSIEKDLSVLTHSSILPALTTFKEWNNIKQFKSLIEEKTDNIKFNITAKKQEIEQSLHKIQKGGVQRISDVQEIKKRILNRLQQFEVRAKEYLEQSFNPSIGTLPKQYQQRIKKLQYLEEEKGGKTIRYLINENYLNTFLNKLDGDIMHIFAKEKETTFSFAKSVETETDHFLRQRNLHLPTKLGQIIDENRMKQSLKAAISFDKRFEKSASDRKAMEYFMGARLYYMMIFMGLSMFGLSGVMSKMGLFMIPVGILLVGLGIYQVWSSQQKDQEERKIKNLEEAHNFLKNQMKKIFQEASKIWEKEVSHHLKQQINRFLETTEQSIKLKEDSAISQKERKKEHVQNILDGLKQQERVFDMGTRNSSMLNGKFDRLKAETCSELTRAILKASTVGKDRLNTKIKLK